MDSWAEYDATTRPGELVFGSAQPETHVLFLRYCPVMSMLPEVGGVAEPTVTPPLKVALPLVNIPPCVEMLPVPLTVK